MISNIEKYKKDIDRLVLDGGILLNAMQYESVPAQFNAALEEAGIKKEEQNKLIKKLPKFSAKYQTWYSEALSVIKVLLPERFDDFKKIYEKPKTRKAITYENYVIEDYLQGLIVTRGWEKEEIVGTRAGIPKFEQQLRIIEAASKRFESSLFDIQLLLQADIFDNELEAAKELNNKGFARAAGAVAGVVLESHLLQVADNHSLKVSKKDPSISDLNDLLKQNTIIEVSVWRFVQHLGDIRNKCDHKKNIDPTKDEIVDLIDGVIKTIKSVF